MPKPYFCDQDKVISEILRVDHAGEYGAVKIYQGQLRYVKKSDQNMIETMLSQEKKHLEYFTQQMLLRGIRPTLLMPMWHYLGYILGAFSVCSIKSSMILTDAIEDVIEKHYAEQIEVLRHFDEINLTKNIAQFRLDELEHKHIAVGYLDKTYLQDLITKIVMRFCRIAIQLSKKI